MTRIAALLAATCLLAFALGPASAVGVVDPTVTQDNIKATICVSGYTGTVRPPASWTDKLKVSKVAILQLPGKLSDYELDHRVPIEVGGAPRDPANLWPQPWKGDRNAHMKDRLENAVHRDVCAGRLTLAQGRAIFLGEFWDEYDRRFGGEK
jgi:hypothetical protein